MYRAKEFLHYVYPLVGQIGWTIAITDDHFLYAINWAMNQLWAYGWYKWERQWHKDAWNNLDQGIWLTKIQTSHPILNVGNFYCGAMNPIEIVDWCWCDPVSEDYNVPCPCSCEWWNKLNLTKARPMDELMSGQYAIVRSQWLHPIRSLWCKSCPEKEDCKTFCGIWWVWWPWGNLVHLKLPSWCGVSNNCDNWIWLTYRRAPQHIFNFNEPILVPDMFVVPLAYFVAAYLMPAFGQGRGGDDINFIQLARQEINELVKHFSILPDSMKAWEWTFNPEKKKPWFYQHGI